MTESVKILLLGDGGVGRTSFCHTYVDKEFKEPMSESFCACGYGEGEAEYEGKTIQLKIHDPTGGDCYDQLRRLSYPKTNVFLLLFSIVEEQSLENLEKFWYQEVVDFGEDTPCILVGTKKELRDPKEMEGYRKLLTKRGCTSDGVSPMSPKIGEKMASKLKLVRKYMEVSSKKVEGLEEVIQFALELVFNPTPPKEDQEKTNDNQKGKCSIQ